MKKIIYIISLTAILFNIQCNKIKEKMKKEIPNYSYKNAGVDQFYYSYEENGNTPIIPLIKPYKIRIVGSKRSWSLFTSNLQNNLGNVIDPTIYFNVKHTYIYGHKSNEKDKKDSDFDSPEKWFIIDTQNEKLNYFDKEKDFKNELKKLNLPEEFLNPDEVFEQYKNDPVLPWFPEDIKKQLEEVKAKKKNT